MSEATKLDSKIWRVKNLRTFNEETEAPDIVDLLLKDRQIIDTESIASFFNPTYDQNIYDPFRFTDMPKAVDRILLAIQNDENILVYGDYDADGVTSSAVIYNTLRKIGAKKISVYIPHRELEGYGLNIQAIHKFHNDNINLIITVDCGSTNVPEVELATEFGIDCIITDHHHVPEVRPQSFAFINAQAASEKYPFKHLAGVGVSFKLASALLRKVAINNPTEARELKIFEKELLDLVAIATVTDLVPLIDENRSLLKFGLIILNQTKRPGLVSLLNLLGNPLVTADVIGFQIGPRLNAAGRMAHADLAFRLLIASTIDEADFLSKELDDLNKQRQKITEQIVAEAEQALPRPLPSIIIAEGHNWPSGLVGLVASRFTEKYHRPCLVVTKREDIIMGSGRSIPSLNIIETLSALPAHIFAKFGGHAQACGFTLNNEDTLREMCTHLYQLGESSMSEEDLLPVINIETNVLLKEIQLELVQKISELEPFGMQNQKPLFLIPAVDIVEISPVGKTGKHLRFIVSDGQSVFRKAIAFGLADNFSDLQIGDKIDLVAEMFINNWQNNLSVELRIIDLKKHYERA